MLSEKIQIVIAILTNSRDIDASVRNLLLLTGKAAKLERVARAVANVPEYMEVDCICGIEEEHKHCPYCGCLEADGHRKDCEVLELREALADLPEDAPGG